jgi:hypothetical protein
MGDLAPNEPLRMRALLALHLFGVTLVDRQVPKWTADNDRGGVRANVTDGIEDTSARLGGGSFVLYCIVGDAQQERDSQQSSPHNCDCPRFHIFEFYMHEAHATPSNPPTAEMAMMIFTVSSRMCRASSDIC